MFYFHPYLVFTHIWGRWPLWRSYFSDGLLQPLTSYPMLSQQLAQRMRFLWMVRVTLRVGCGGWWVYGIRRTSLPWKNGGLEDDPASFFGQEIDFLWVFSALNFTQCNQLTSRSWFQIFWIFTPKRREDDPSSLRCLWNWASWLFSRMAPFKKMSKVACLGWRKCGGTPFQCIPVNQKTCFYAVDGLWLGFHGSWCR